MNTETDAVDRIISQWQHELPQLDTRAMATFGRLKRSAALLAPMLNTVFARHGLHPGEFDVLATLRRSGEPFVLSPTELYSCTMVTSGAMTHRLKLLEQRGLIVRLPNPADSRSLLVKLSGEGRQLIDAAVAEHAANETECLAGLSETDRLALDQGLRALLRLWEQPET